MKRKFIAITKEGSEFFYQKNSMIATPEKSAHIIADLLTKNNYKIKAGEKWHVYDNDNYTDGFIRSEIKSYKPGSGKIRLYDYFSKVMY